MSEQQINRDYPTRRNPKVFIGAAAVIVIIIVATYGVLTYWRPRFVVYTYDSFMDWGDEGADVVLKRAFAPFEEKYGIDINFVVLQGDANFVVSRLNAEAANPVADAVIGIDNILVLQESARNVLEPYESPNLALINATLTNSLSPDHYLTPFDYGLVTLVYSMSKINTSTHPELDYLTFSDLVLSGLASSLVTEDPHLSSPGLSFLLSQIAVYQEILHQDWTSWWNAVKSEIDIEEGWTEAWTAWSTDPTKNLLVSYGTDPAYSAYTTGSSPDIEVAPFYYDGQHWAWMQVEGVGLVKNGPNPTLGKAFIDYCLNISVQQEVALNQWMYPVRSDVSLPAVFDYAIHPDNIGVLNTLLNSTMIATNLQDWLQQYDSTMTPG